MRLAGVSATRARPEGALKLAVPRGALWDGTIALIERLGMEREFAGWVQRIS